MNNTELLKLARQIRVNPLQLYNKWRALLNQNPLIKRAYRDILLQHKKQVCKVFQTIFAEFERNPMYCDTLPFLAFLRVYYKKLDKVVFLRIPNTTPINGYWFDMHSGWIVKYQDIRALRETKWIYLQYFWNKRRAKRYIFGLKANKRTKLLAILTHISAPAKQQKHLSTRQAVMLARRIALQKVLPINQVLLEHKYLDILRRTKNREQLIELLNTMLEQLSTDLFPLHIDYYNLDRYALSYWRHPHDKIPWQKLFEQLVVNRQLLFARF